MAGNGDTMVDILSKRAAPGGPMLCEDDAAQLSLP
jgi:hypothetical protein